MPRLTGSKKLAQTLETGYDEIDEAEIDYANARDPR